MKESVKEAYQMKTANNPDEARRLSALYSLKILDTSPEERFDRFTRLATRLFDVPIALISFVDEDRQWFKSCQGLSVSETPRAVSFCDHTIKRSETFVIPDTLLDDRFSDNPMVTGSEKVRFYAGHPLKALDGSRIGAFCIKDRRPRILSKEDLATLTDLSGMVENEIHLVKGVELQARQAEANQKLEKEVAERKRTEEAFKESEKRYRTLVEHAGDALFVHDLDGKIVDVNQRTSEGLGYTREELIGKPVGDIEQAIDLSSALWKKLRPGEPVTVEGVHRRRDGTTFPVEVRLGMFDSGGEKKILALARDITVRKETDEMLRNAHEELERQAEEEIDRLAAIPRENPNPVLETDLNGQVTYANPATRVVMERLGAEKIEDLLPADHTELAKVFLEEGESFHGIGVAVKDRILSWSYHPVPDEGVVHIYGGDITERHRAEEALRKSEERLETLVKHIPEGVLLLDGEGRLILANPVAEEYLSILTDGVKVGEAISRIGEHSAGKLLVPLNGVQEHEVTVEGPPKRTYEVSICSVSEEGPDRGWALVIRDVTKDREAHEKAQQQDRLAAVGQLAAGIAHDFNNLLTVVIGVAQLQEMNPDLPEAAKKEMKTIISGGQRAAQLVQQILDFSRKSVVERQSVDLIPFLKETTKLLERTLTENIRIVSDFEKGEYIVEASLTQLQQVITNLAVNARDAMQEGGELRLAISHLRVESDERPPLPGMRSGDWVVWTVSDTGEGIPPGVLRHIFEPFFTTKKPGEGTGLGLAQVYGIVKQHQGEIEVRSRLGKGTSFTIYLPKASGKKTASVQESEQIPLGNRETVLVVEDKADVKDVAKLILENLNYRVLTASNGQEAVEVYDSYGDNISLVITDMVMPQMGGLELLDALKERDPGIRVVIMTGYPLGKDQLPPGIAGSLGKPLQLEKVSRVMVEALENGK